MEFYEITIRPTGAFGTPLKGDTIFGHFCWQAAYDDSLIDGDLAGQLARYDEAPFIVFSSAFPKLVRDGEPSYALKRPDLPLSRIFGHDVSRYESILLRKERKQKKWMWLRGDLKVELAEMELFSDEELAFVFFEAASGEIKRAMRRSGIGRVISNFSQPHNTINRLTGTTGRAEFAPFLQSGFCFFPGSLLAVFVLVDESATDIERVSKAMGRIGLRGFGRDASTGMGRFEVVGYAKMQVSAPDHPDACYCLAPSVPEKNQYKQMFFKTFVRFGKHGDALARGSNPFKCPVIMADEGAVLVPEDKGVFQRTYLGSAVRGISKLLPETVAQGYAPFIPLRLENPK